MGIPIRNFEEIRYAFQKAVPSGHLCCFFAIDDRPSLRPALEHLHECGKWIDTLAKATNVFAFFPVSVRADKTEVFFVGERMMTIEESKYICSLPTIDYVLNPTLQMASQFEILPHELPGLIIFRAEQGETAIEACFVSVPETALVGSSGEVERFLAVLFSELITALSHADKNSFESVTENLKSCVSQGCIVRRTGATIHSPLADVIIAEFDAAREQPFEPAELERIYRQIPDNDRGEIKVFLSYASEDRETVTAFHDRLARAGFDPWMDSEDILPGEKWDECIQQAVESADFVVFFISNRSVRKRGYIQRELKTILRQCEEQLDDDIYLIPVKIDNCEIPKSIEQYQWLNFGRYNDGWRRMFQSFVKGHQRKRN